MEDFEDYLPCYESSPRVAPEVASPKAEDHVKSDTRVDRMPVPVGAAEAIERDADAPDGGYFVAIARKRIHSIVSMQARWMKKRKNKDSKYSGIQGKIHDFFDEQLKAFDFMFGYWVERDGFGELTRSARTRSKKCE